jgi:hypothetical protein
MSHCGHGVAGDNQHFDIFLDQKFGNLCRVAVDGFHRLHTIRHASGVAEIDDVFKRQTFHQGPDDRQTADAGIENAYGTICFCVHGNVFTELLS